MGSKSQNWEELVQNLKDSGCGSDIIKRYLDCYGCGDSSFWRSCTSVRVK